MTKKIDALQSVQIFTRTTPQVAKQLDATAERYRVNKSDYLRWLIEDAISGRYTPSHLSTKPVTEEKQEVDTRAGWKRQ